MPSGKIPSAPKIHSETARAGAHREAEQQLAAHVAADRVLDPGGEVVFGRAVARRHHAADERADPLAVEQHVDRQHDHEDQAEAGLTTVVSRSRPKLTMSLVPPTTFSCSVCSAGSPCFLISMSMPVAIEVVLEVREARVGAVDDRGHVVAELARLVGDRVGEQEADGDADREQPEVDGGDGDTARSRARRCRPRRAG